MNAAGVLDHAQRDPSPGPRRAGAERSPPACCPVLLAALLLTACGGGSDASSTTSDFELIGVNVVNGQEWRINRPIVLTFNQDVDFATVNLNTVSIADLQGLGATGSFYPPTGPDGVDRTRVVFQPSCPTLEDFSDAGLRPGGDYRLVVHGSQHGPTVRSTSGDPLEDGEYVVFHTPDSEDPLDLFSDTVPGPPRVRVLPLRPQPGEEIDPGTPATNVEIGGVRRFLGRDPVDQLGRLEEGLRLPLNHYSLPENQVAFNVHFNQPVLATQANLGRLELQYLDAGQVWSVMPSTVVLTANCTESGARARVDPHGILPQGSALRVLLRAGFSDLTGDATAEDDPDFARTETLLAGEANPLFPEVGGPEVDEKLETFDAGGPGPDSLEDTSAVFPVPDAEWGGGRLAASFAFGGTGGPGGDFDWHIPHGTDLVLDTSSDVIFGGPGGAQTGSQPVTNGVVDVRDLFIPETSRLILVGPNTCTILAAGEVLILGEISLRGADNRGVTTLATANQPEPGAQGNAGGGDGGDGSPLTSQSSPSGSPGKGAFDLAGLAGGGGGEASYSNTVAGARRGAGGGGGRLGPDVLYDHDGLAGTPLVRCQTLIGLDAEHGGSGQKSATGAHSHSGRAQGGAIGPSPFLDGDPDNDFLGAKLTTDGQAIVGELDEVWAGSGGGGGGDSAGTNTWPSEPFTPWSDQKGAGGGGGAGGLTILALGSITIGSETATGGIVADGGTGGGGENVSLRVGGGSGGGSGGHIVLSSAAEIVIHGRAKKSATWYGDDPGLIHHRPRPVSALGGQGGAGQDDRGGSKGLGPTLWGCDRVPFTFFDGMTDVPPQGNPCFNSLPNKNDPDGPVVGAGGDGGPGMIQLHVDDLANLRFPTLEALLGGTYASGLDVTQVMAPPPVGWKQPGLPPDPMVPFFGRLSMAQSRWIPLGLARVDGAGGLDQVLLHALGGVVPHGPGETVDLEDPIVGPQALLDPGWHVSLDASDLGAGDGRYRANPALLRLASLRLEDSSDPGHCALFQVAQASYDEAADRFELEIDAAGPSPEDFDAAGDVLASLVPHSLRVVSNGILDAYPDDSNVTVGYDATVLDPYLGGPSTNLSYSALNGDFTGDVEDLNQEHWDFVRFRAIFDLDALQDGVDLKMPRPGLDSLRIQFEF